MQKVVLQYAIDNTVLLPVAAEPLQISLVGSHIMIFVAVQVENIEAISKLEKKPYHFEIVSCNRPLKSKNKSYFLGTVIKGLQAYHVFQLAPDDIPLL